MKDNQIKTQLEEIEHALNCHYERKCYVKKEMEKARKALENGNAYTFSAKLYSAKFGNREHRIFAHNGHYALYSGWSTSSDQAFLKNKEAWIH